MASCRDFSRKLTGSLPGAVAILAASFSYRGPYAEIAPDSGVFFARRLSWLTVFLTDLTCRTVGTPAGISARFGFKQQCGFPTIF
jgi:hypothetical protein